MVLADRQLDKQNSIRHSVSGFGDCLPGSTTDLGQSKLDTPDFTLVAQTILSNELQLGVPGTC